MTDYRRELRSFVNDEEPVRKQYGRVPLQAAPRQMRELPTDMVFSREDTGDVYPVSTNGAMQFLAKCQLPTSQENVDWVLDGVLNVPNDQTVNLNGIEVGVSFSYDRDPRNASLAQLGIAKSMVARPISRPPTMGEGIPVQQGVSYPPGYGGSENLLMGKIPTGDGVLFGKKTMEVYKMKKNAVGGYNRQPVGNVGGLLCKAHITK